MPTAPLCLSLSRISSVSKIFPVLMLYRLWEEGIVDAPRACTQQLGLQVGQRAIHSFG